MNDGALTPDDRARIVRLSITKHETGKFLSESRIAYLAQVHESTVRRVIREAIRVGVEAVGVAELSQKPEGSIDE